MHPVPGLTLRRGRLRALFAFLASGGFALLLGAIGSRGASVPSTSAADEYLVDTWQADDGLPQSSVNAVVQTRDGYLWVATYNGLARFDGLRFVVLHPGNTPGLRSSRVLQLHQDRRGALWVATEDGGLYRWQDGRLEALHPPNLGTIYKFVRSMADDAAGRLWLVSGEGQLIRLDGAAFDIVSKDWNLTAPSAQLAVADASGRVWVAAYKELAVLRGADFEPLSLSTNRSGFQVQALATSRAGGCWVIAENRLRRLDAGHWVGERTAPDDALGAPSAVLEDRQGRVWIGTRGAGLWRVGTDAVALRVTRADGLASDHVSSLCEDTEGNLWVGTQGGGLNRLKPALFRVLGRRQGLASDAILSVCEDREGALWIGTNGDGLDRVGAGAVTHFGPDQGLRHGQVAAVAADRAGQVWAGTLGGGLHRLEGERFVALPTEPPLSPFVQAAFEDRQGTLWLGLQLAQRSAVVAWRGGNGLGFQLPGSASSIDVRAYAEDREGNLWVGTNGDGLYRFRDGAFVHFGRAEGLPSDLIWSLHAESGTNSSGALWIGTFGAGLCRWADGRFSHVSSRQGLPNDVICHVAEDRRGNLWISSYGGLFRLAKAEFERVARTPGARLSARLYAKEEGLPTREGTGGSQPSGWTTRDGRLCFATVKGLVIVDPEALPTNPVPPPVVIESLTVDGVERTARPSADGRAAPGGAELWRIAPGKVNYEFRYTGLSLGAPGQVRFRHQLEGLDAGWIDAGPRRVAPYTALRPRAYRFRVQAMNADGVWNEAGATQAFVVEPFFWQTWWFVAAVVLALGGGVAGGARFVTARRLRHEMERLERQTAVERERTRIARDIHDDLGASLTQIAMLSELGETQVDQPERVAVHLQRISAKARAVVQSLDEIVWAVNPKNDNLAQLVHYLCQFAVEHFETTDLRCWQDAPPAVPEYPLAAETRHHVYLAVKEALHNAAKHSGAREVWVRVACLAETLEIVIEDNGRGFDAATINPAGNGLRNLEARLRSVGGVAELRSAPGQGTRWRFTLRLPGLPSTAPPP